MRRHRPRRDPFNSAFTTGATPPATVIRARLRKASSILSHSPRFPTKLRAHSSRYPPTPPTASLTPLLTELSSLSTYSSVQLSLHRRAPHHAYRVLIGILLQGGRYPFLERHNWTAGGTSWKTACDTEERSLRGRKLAILEEENVD